MSAGDKRRMGSRQSPWAQHARRVGGNIAVRDRVQAPVCRQGFLCSQKSEEMSRPVAPG